VGDNKWKQSGRNRGRSRKSGEEDGGNFSRSHRVDVAIHRSIPFDFADEIIRCRKDVFRLVGLRRALMGSASTHLGRLPK
jgi:hypothetical protein